jgi:hypothetical protein
MLDPFKALRKLMGEPDPTPLSELDIEVIGLHMGLRKIEAQNFCEHLIDSMAHKIINAKSRKEIEDTPLPPDTIESWLRLDDDARLYVFMYLLGALYGFMLPPEDHLGAPL